MFLARMDEGSAGFTMASIDLSEAVNKAAAPFKSVAVSGGKRLSTSIATGVRTHADAAAVAQVVELLLDNATRYASEGSVIELSLCAVSHGKGKGAAELVVSNAVDELPEGDLDRLFDRFYRADASRTTLKRLLRLVFCHRTFYKTGEPFLADQFLLTCASAEKEIEYKPHNGQEKEYKYPCHCFNRITIIKYHYKDSSDDNHKIKHVKSNSKDFIKDTPLYHIIPVIYL